MNKQVKILLILVIAALAIYFIYTRKPWSSLKGGDETEFAVEDTAAISKVFIADGRGNKSLLERTANGWMVNGSTIADERKINLLLQTIHDVKLRNPIGQAEFNNVIKDLTAAGVKVEIYNKDELIQTMYVGQMTSDQTGTYMMIEGASAPYVTHIPGFIGYLSPRFLPQPVKWRSRLVFDLKAADIATVNVAYPAEPAQSFSVDNSGLQPVVKDASGVALAIRDTNFVKYYLSGFSQLYGEGFDELYNPAQQDSIRKSQAYMSMSITSKTGNTYSLQLHLKPLEKGSKDRFTEDGKQRETDTERYLAFANGSTDLLYVQQYNFGRVLRRLDDFKGR